MDFITQYPNLTSPSKRLTSKHIDVLNKSGISRNAAYEQGIRTSKSGNSYVIPVYDIKGNQAGDTIRIDQEKVEAGSYPDKRNKTRKFQTINHNDETIPTVHFPKLAKMEWSKIKDNPYQEMYITEGPKKALKMCLEGFPCIGLLSCNGGLNKKDLADPLKEIKWKDRHVYIVFDNDKNTNENVLNAEKELSEKLKEYGAKVHIIDLPQDQQAKGADDFLAKSRYHRDLFESSRILAR